MQRIAVTITLVADAALTNRKVQRRTAMGDILT